MDFIFNSVSGTVNVLHTIFSPADGALTTSFFLMVKQTSKNKIAKQLYICL